MVDQFLKTLVFWNQKKNSITLASFIKIQDGGLHGLDQLIWNDPERQTSIRLLPTEKKERRINKSLTEQCGSGIIAGNKYQGSLAKIKY